MNNNRIGDSSILLTASSQSEHGIRQSPFIYYKNTEKMKFLNLSVFSINVLKEHDVSPSRVFEKAIGER